MIMGGNKCQLNSMVQYYQCRQSYNMKLQEKTIRMSQLVDLGSSLKL